MIRKTTTITLSMAAAIIGLLSVGAVQADTKHDSNTLHKIGKAIQYPLRKASENASIDAHRAEGRKSVTSLRPQKATAVITPNGKTFVIHHRGTVWAHRRHHRHHHHYVK